MAVPMNLQHLLFEPLILLLPLTGLALPLLPVVVATGRDLKGLAHTVYGMVLFHCPDPLVALLGASERMPNFF